MNYQKKRRKTPVVHVGHVTMGGTSDVVVQAMTDTATADTRATLKQTVSLAEAGAELVRWTINDDEAAQAAIKMIAALRKRGSSIPIIGDFHFNGHLLLSRYPALAQGLDKYRINPGNIGSGKRFDDNFATFIDIAVLNKKPVRIGANWGSLNPELLTSLMDRNAALKNPRSDKDVVFEAMIRSVLDSARYALKRGLRRDQIVLSVKMSDLQDMVHVYQLLAKRCDHVLHLGLTEAGSGVQGISASSAALAILLQQGIGDTIRVSLTPQPGVPRTQEVLTCCSILQSLGLKFFAPQVISCPGCGRTDGKLFRQLAADVKEHIEKKMPQWRQRYSGVERLKIAVMGCVVNGPGESRHADIGISLPGRSETPTAPVYLDGKQVKVLKGISIKVDFLRLLENYIAKRFS